MRRILLLASVLILPSLVHAQSLATPPLRIYDGLSATTPLPLHFKLRLSLGTCADNASAHTTDCTITGFTGASTDLSFLKSVARTVQIADSTVVAQGPVTFTIKGGSAASSVDSTNAAAGNPLTVTAGAGGATTAIGGGAAGAGALLTVNGGAGGAASATTGLGGGAGGSLSLVAGGAGAAGTGGSGVNGGAGAAGGGINLSWGGRTNGAAGGAGANGGNGGSHVLGGNTTAASGGTITFGVGGDIGAPFGNGGAAGSGTGTTGGNGGAGASIGIRTSPGGNGGSGAGATNGNGGTGGHGGGIAIGTLKGGNGGNASGSGVPGNGNDAGSLVFSTAAGGNAGTGGAGGATGGAAGPISFLTGNAGTGGNNNGAGITLDVGTATGTGTTGVIAIATTRGDVTIGNGATVATYTGASHTFNGTANINNDIVVGGQEKEYGYDYALSPAYAEVTAHVGGGQGSAVAIGYRRTLVSACASDADSAVLPAVIAGGAGGTIYNSTAHSANLFPPSGTQINALGNNTAIAVPAGSWALWMSLNNGNYAVKVW